MANGLRQARGLRKFRSGKVSDLPRCLPGVFRR
jgi:hypothetical protein